MSYLLSTLITGALLMLFFVIVVIERRRGHRYFDTVRRKLDADTSRMFYVLEHVDWPAFFAHITKVSLERIAHDMVHGTLILIRAVEKSLTRAIRVLRERVAHQDGVKVEGFQLKETMRQFRKSLTKKDS